MSLEILERVRALPPALDDKTIEQLSRELHSPIDRDVCERQITRAVELRLYGDLTSFDPLPERLRALAFVRFDNALETVGLHPSVAMFNGTTGLPIAHKETRRP